MRISFLTYGCKVNRYETELIRQEILASGFQAEEDADKADCVIINTCTVTGKIDSEIRRKAAGLKEKGKKVIITGCLPKSSGARDYVSSADLIVQNEDKFNLSSYYPVLGKFDYHESVTGLSDFSGRSRAYAKAVTGCNRFCSYCEVPHVRGSVIISRPEADILAEIRVLSHKGFREIVLTGVNLGLYGTDTGHRLSELLKRACHEIDGCRLRLSSIGPRETTNELIDAVKEGAAEGKICPHFHMSLQSGDPGILMAMKRNYTPDIFMERLNRITQSMPLCGITTDIIAGFPGETDVQHKNTLEFIQKAPLSRLHVFPYSDRPDTEASAMEGKLPDSIKKKRVREIMELGSLKELEFAKANSGRILKVLVENDSDKGMLTGYTENYLKVVFEGDSALAGELADVIITEPGSRESKAIPAKKA